MFYFLLLVALAVFFSISPRLQKKGAWLLFLIMLLLCGLRAANVGTDTFSYIAHYLYNDESESNEPLYFIISDICRFLGFSAHQFLFVMALVTFVPLYIIVMKASKNPCFSALIYITFSVVFFPQTFNGVRQNMAMSFALFSIYYIEKDDWKRSVIFAFIAVLSHYSFAIVIPFVLLLKIINNIDIKIVLALLFGAFVFGMTLEQSDYFFFIFTYLQQFSDNAIMENYAAYGNDNNISSLNIIGTLAATVPNILFSLLLYNKENRSSIYYKLFVLGAFVSCVFISIHYIYRLAAYFMLPIMLLLPDTMSQVSKLRRFLLIAMTVFMVLWYLYGVLTAGPGSPNGIFPYSTCLY